ncbi:DUF2867 domain-containing protein [Luteimonas aquatica]|uniref:DUF2867 domain-containing protein n=1 Tax=Luteimonas aquatica TaxID=450364 RepID=UPI001F58500D|nr:DUF2867 domain-containing protein [Luteimonas aquatica]
MLTTTKAIRTFPSVRIRPRAGGLPIEVSLIAQLGHGGGDQLIEDASARQRGHEAFIDELDEPSARLGGVDLDNGDATSLYSFTVGVNGHPFHRHAGHRVFTAISGSAGTQLRFSTASSEEIASDPRRFVAALHHVEIPPDCLFTVRFGGGTWHQFLPLRARSAHPAMFALSCHTNELGGDLAPALRQQVIDNRADIPALTEVLPQAVLDLLRDGSFDALRVPTHALSLDAAPASPLARLCARTRGVLGRARGAWSRWRGPSGFLADNGGGRLAEALAAPPAGSMLYEQLDGKHTQEDTFALAIAADELAGMPAATVLAAVLEGFLENRPLGVSQLMAFRNVLVRPLGLRTSPLGCPASSLLATESRNRFAGRHPVLAQRVEGDMRAQVILGADDKHLVFRTCVGVERVADGRLLCTMGTRVRTRNLFGRLYMAAIDRMHRGYIAPTMLRLAVDHAVTRLREAPRREGAPANAGPLACVASVR